MNMNINIFGASGFAKEVYALVKRLGHTPVAFVDKENGEPIYGVPVISEEYYNPAIPIVIALGNPSLRSKVVNNILQKFPYARFPVLCDPTVQLLDPSTINIGKGTIICAGTILTCDIQLGDFSILNLSTTIGHDCVLGDYFTTAPGVNISGKVKTGKKIYFGTNSSCIEDINITDTVTIGMGSVVIKDIPESGTYVGTPIKKIKG